MSPASGSASAPITPRVCAFGPVRPAELHPVGVEAGSRVDPEHARLFPSGERAGGPLVAVALALPVAREEQAHRIVRVGRLERCPPLLVDHVVGWGGEQLEVRAGCAAVVAQTGKGEEIGHEALRVRECRPVVAQHRSDARAGARAIRLTREATHDVDDEGDAYFAFQEGSQLLAGGNVHAAVVALERARRLEPEKGSVRETLARAYYRSGRFSNAEREFRAALDLEPVNDYAHYGLGLCLLRTGDRSGARAHLRLAIVMRPDNVDYQHALDQASD